jgi:hypothetical protein
MRCSPWLVAFKLEQPFHPGFLASTHSWLWQITMTMPKRSELRRGVETLLTIVITHGSPQATDWTNKTRHSWPLDKRWLHQGPILRFSSLNVLRRTALAAATLLATHLRIWRE